MNNHSGIARGGEICADANAASRCSTWRTTGCTYSQVFRQCPAAQNQLRSCFYYQYDVGARAARCTEPPIPSNYDSPCLLGRGSATHSAALQLPSLANPRDGVQLFDHHLNSSKACEGGRRAVEKMTIYYVLLPSALGIGPQLKQEHVLFGIGHP